MGLDSSGRPDGERGMAVANALGQRGSKCVTAVPWKSPIMAWSTVCDDYFRVADKAPGICEPTGRTQTIHWKWARRRLSA